MSSSGPRRTAIIWTTKKGGNENTLGDLYKTGNEPIPYFHRVTFPLFAKFIPHLFVLGYGPRISNSRGVNPPRDPCALRSDHRTVSARPNRALDNPTSVSHSHKREPCHETERTEIGWVSYEAVWAPGDQPVFWFDAEVEGKERAEGFIALEAKKSSEGDQGNPEQCNRRDGKVR